MQPSLSQTSSQSGQASQNSPGVSSSKEDLRPPWKCPLVCWSSEVRIMVDAGSDVEPMAMVSIVDGD